MKIICIFYLSCQELTYRIFIRRLNKGIHPKIKPLPKQAIFFLILRPVCSGCFNLLHLQVWVFSKASKELICNPKCYVPSWDYPGATLDLFQLLINLVSPHRKHRISHKQWPVVHIKSLVLMHTKDGIFCNFVSITEASLPLATGCLWEIVC